MRDILLWSNTGVESFLLVLISSITENDVLLSEKTSNYYYYYFCCPPDFPVVVTSPSSFGISFLFDMHECALRRRSA